ncbi:sexual stage-specific protein precursor, putative [Plasmodium relictum]|uniref:Sexual stage-specific protein, putative n=1 Tax=Plasmodium relictum TaxID=85471 RepID=A0A1J1H1V3_PLARL|nr:sexual stage-specific protein precursor, putative [Plasmodium relictum]CRG98550.1 sexual stage-specific protein precursor, putative [Plasmodium relictum]
MNFGKFVSSLSLVLILYSIVELAFANADEKAKKFPGKHVSTSSVNHPQGNASMKDSIDRMSSDSQHALEEIKVISNLLDKKTSINRNLIIGTAATNIALLLLLSGLMGYNTKRLNADDEGKEKSGRKKDNKGDSPKETEEDH